MTRKEARRIIATWLVSSKGAKGQRGYIEGWFDEEDAEAFRMAIEALSAKPSGDIISRANAICAIENTDCELTAKEWDELTGAIMALPSAEAVMRDAAAEERASVQRYIDSISTESVQGWVPTSERQPEEDGRYLVTYRFLTGEPRLELLHYGEPCGYKGRMWYYCDSECGDVSMDGATAWMPLPEPYMSEEEVGHGNNCNCDNREEILNEVCKGIECQDCPFAEGPLCRLRSYFLHSNCCADMRGEQNHSMCDNCKHDYCPQCADEKEEQSEKDCISRQALIDEILEDGNGAVLSYPTGMYEDELVELIEKQMIQHFIGVIEYAPPVEPKIYGNEHNCIMTLFGECSYSETGCGDCAVVEKVRDALKGECPPVEPKSVCEDVISRQAVEEMIKAEMPERGMWEIEGDKEKETVCEVCVDLMQKLSELPPVTPTDKDKRIKELEDLFADMLESAQSVPTERTGEWINDTRYSGWTCTHCNYHDGNKTDNFCPNCGAKMLRDKDNAVDMMEIVRCKAWG